AEHDGVGHGHDAALGLREGQAVEGTDHARHHAAVRHVRSAVADVGHRTIAADDEADRDAPLEVRVVAQPVLVAEAETREVLADDALDDRGGQAPAPLGGPHAHLRRLGAVGAAEAAVARAEALAGAGAGPVPEGADAAEADALAAAAAALADAGEA